MSRVVKSCKGCKALNKGENRPTCILGFTIIKLRTSTGIVDAKKGSSCKMKCYTKSDVLVNARIQKGLSHE